MANEVQNLRVTRCYRVEGTALGQPFAFTATEAEFKEFIEQGMRALNHCPACDLWDAEQARLLTRQEQEQEQQVGMGLDPIVASFAASCKAGGGTPFLVESLVAQPWAESRERE